MTQLAKQIQSQMDQLPQTDLEDLLAHLIGLLDPGAEEPGAQEEWNAEILRRVAEADSGVDVGIPAEEAHRMVRERLERRK